MFERIVTICVFLAVLVSAPAHTQGLPESVVEPYRAYEAAVQEGDVEEAAENAIRAWRAGERESIPSQTLAVLADNAANYAVLSGDHQAAIAPYNRLNELLLQEGAAPLLRAQMLRLTAESYLAIENPREALTLLDNAEELLEERDNESVSQEWINNRVLYAYGLSSNGRPRSAGRAASLALVQAEEDGIALSSGLGAAAFFAGIHHSYEEEPEDAAYWFAVSRHLLAGSEASSNMREAAFHWGNLERDKLEADDRIELLQRLVENGYLTTDEQQSDQDSVARNANVVRPVVISRRPPSYPSRAAEYGAEGMALVRYSVNTEGRVVDPVVVFSIPYEEFGEASLRALRSWRYEPATENGEPVLYEGLVIQMDFMLED